MLIRYTYIKPTTHHHSFYISIFFRFFFWTSWRQCILAHFTCDHSLHRSQSIQSTFLLFPGGSSFKQIMHISSRFGSFSQHCIHDCFLVFAIGSHTWRSTSSSESLYMINFVSIDQGCFCVWQDMLPSKTFQSVTNNLDA